MSAADQTTPTDPPGTDPPGTDPPGTDPPAADRSRAAAFGLLALGGLVSLVTAARPWWVGTADGSTVTFSGTESTGGLAQAVPFVLLAGTLLALALRATGRRVVGVLLGLTALGGVVAGVLRPPPPRELVLTRLQTVTLGDSYQLTTGGWPVGYAVGAAVAALGAVVMVARAAGWTSRAARFERTATTAVPASEQSDATLWAALDAGLDPTDPTAPSAVPEPGSAVEPAPIRTSSDDGVRMGPSAPRPTPTGTIRAGSPRGADSASRVESDVHDTGAPEATTGDRTAEGEQTA